MKKLLEVGLICCAGVAVYIGINALHDLFPRKHKIFETDQALREEALKAITPLPNTYETLLEKTTTSKNPLTLEKIALGKELFFDKQLSFNNDISCASCHDTNNGGADNKPTAIGHNNQQNPFHLNTPTVFNAALYFAQFWDGRVKDVEEQAKGPIQAPFEMNMQPKVLVEKLLKTSYKQKFEKVFQDSPSLSFENITLAIAAYERTLLTPSAFDEFLRGNDNAISKKAKEGLTIYLTRGCKGCHAGTTIGAQSIQRFPLRASWNDWLNVKLNWDNNSFFPKIQIIDRSFPFENIGGFKGKNQENRFRVPSLRNVTKTAPYFHNGAIKELEDAIKIMGEYQLGEEFTALEVENIMAFLKTLEGHTLKR